MKNKKTKAGRLVKVAYATYRKGHKDPQVRKLAQDIFILAMEDPSAPQEFGEVSPDQLEAELNAAVSSGDFEAASQALEALKSFKGESIAEGDDMMPPMDEELEDDGMEEDLDDDDLGEGALTPGDEVPPPPAPDLAPAQVASLVALARKVKSGGHPDLARRITRALGL